MTFDVLSLDGATEETIAEADAKREDGRGTDSFFLACFAGIKDSIRDTKSETSWE